MTLTPEYPFKSNYFYHDGHRFHYIDEGQGEVVFLVHGNPTWSFYYRRLITLLAKTNRVIALDHLGCGLSDKPESYDYCLANHIKNLHSLIDHLDTKRFSMVVHDWGGAIGTGCCAKMPEKVNKLVILNTAAFRSKRIPFRIRICRWPLIGKIIVRGFNGFALPATVMAVTKPLTKEIRQAYLKPYSSWKNRVAVYSFVKDIPLNDTHPTYNTLVEVEDGLQLLKKQGVQVLILWGGKDFCFNKYFYDEWVERFPEAEKHFYPNGGHYILEDEWADIGPRIKEFIDH